MGILGKELLAILACIPPLLLCNYIYMFDRDKEPFKMLYKLFFYGAFSIIPIVLLELISDSIVVIDKKSFINTFIYTFVSISLIEEGVKWVIINKSIFNDREFNHPYDSIIYCVFCSLGFALVENIIYVVENGFLTGILRGITSIPLHTFVGIIMGYYLGKSKQEDINNDENLSKKYMFLSIILPITIHTIYDSLLFMESKYASVFFIILVIIIYYFSYYIVEKISIISKNFDGSKYNSKKRIKHISDTDLFIDSLLKVLIVTLALIAFAAIRLFIE